MVPRKGLSLGSYEEVVRGGWGAERGTWVPQELLERESRLIPPGGNKCKGEIGAFSLCSVAVNWPVQFVRDIQDSLTTQFQHP